MDTYHANIEAIAEYLRKGEVSRSQGMLGLEVEHIIVDAHSLKPVPYRADCGSPNHGKPCVEDILHMLSPLYEDEVFTIDSSGASCILGLGRKGAPVSLEPGAQIEVSIGPVCNISQFERPYERFVSEVEQAIEPYGYILAPLGYQPAALSRDVQLIPKHRYAIMDEHFEHTGRHGVCMMRGSASTQVSIDFSDEADCIQKMRVATALAPIIYFLTDNSPVFEGCLVGVAGGRADIAASGLRIPRRMARSAIWDDVDAARSMSAGFLFENGAGYEAYARMLMNRPVILTLADAGDDSTAKPHGQAPAREVFDGHLMSTGEIEHLLSMFFFDVRLKQYIEIRMADSMPLEYALAYCSLIKGLFYDPQTLADLSEMLQGVREADISAAKSSLVELGYDASVFGRPAAKWAESLVQMAQDGLERLAGLDPSRSVCPPEDDRPYLKPLEELVSQRKCLVELPCRMSFNASQMHTLEERYLSCVERFKGDEEGRRAAFDYLQGSTAIYKGEVIRIGYIPKIFDEPAIRYIEWIQQTTYAILEKVMRRYAQDPGYRALFGFEKRLEGLTLVDKGYPCAIPIGRFDIFLDEETGEFKFCELNTDGSSAMNEDRESSLALSLTPAFEAFCKERPLKRQELFDGWVREFIGIYDAYDARKDDPTMAIVDFEHSAGPNEFEVFRQRFEAAGMHCIVRYMHEIEYREAADGDDGGLYAKTGERIDVVYRRAVTSEIMDALGEGASEAGISSDEVLGACALVTAFERHEVCLIGAFDTQIAHCKQIFQVLHHPATSQILTGRERAFVREHVPFTCMLDELFDDGAQDALAGHDSDSLLHDKDRWIIKPSDRYGSSGVFAGVDFSHDEWGKAVRAKIGQGYVAQEYCEQYATPNFKPMPLDEGVAPWNNLIGFYNYGGKFGGLFNRAGQKGIIVGYAGGITVPTFLTA